jgi:hypothetical protein
MATIHCSAPGLPVLPMGLAHPLHLPHPLHLATNSDPVLDLADPLHLAHLDFDLILDSDSAVPDESGDATGSESFEETALQSPLHDQSHHPEEGEAEVGGCHPVVDHPCLHTIH